MIRVNKKLTNPRVSFTPTFYKKAYKSYKAGQFGELIELMREATTDSHVSGCLIGRRAGFQRDWSVVPYDPEKEADQEVALFYQSVFSELDTRLLFKKIHESALFTFSVIDFTWDVVDGRQIPVDFKAYQQKYFKYDEDGVLRIDFGKRLEEIPEETLVCEFREQPLMLPVLRDHILKNFGLESWASFLETFGEAIIIGKYPMSAGEDFKTAINDAVNAIAASSRGTMPDGASVEMLETNRSTGDHRRFVEQADNAISISLLGHANAVSETTGAHFGENLAPFKVRKELAIDDISYIMRHLNRLIRIIHTRNFTDTRFPRFQIDTTEPINVSERLDVIDSAYDKGWIVDPEEFRKLGLKVHPDQEVMQREQLPL